MTWEQLTAAVLQFPARLALALTLWAEGRSEGVAGIVAIAWVIRNRTVARKQTYNEVVLAKHQFSCWPPYNGDQNEEVLRGMCERILDGRPTETRSSSLDSVMWTTCLRIADGVIAGVFPDPVAGAQHYLTTKLYQSAECPSWAKTLKPVTVIGRHTFLR